MKIIDIINLAIDFLNFAKYAADRPLPLKPPGVKAKQPEPVSFSPSIIGTRPSSISYKKKLDNYLDTVEVIKKSPKKEESKVEESKPIISESDRITITYEEFDPSRFILSGDETYTQNKPSAFYYAFGSQWIRQRELTEGNVYCLNLDMSKIFQLTPESLSEFIEKYCHKISSSDMSNILTLHRKISPVGTVVNWRKFKKDYTGMEIADLDSIKSEARSLGVNLNFLSTVDVDGGFFWDKSALLKAEKIAKIEDGKVIAVDPISYILDEGSVVEIRESDEESGGGEYIFFEEEEKKENERKLREKRFTSYYDFDQAIKKSFNHNNDKCESVMTQIYLRQKLDPEVYNFIYQQHSKYNSSGHNFAYDFFRKYADEYNVPLEDLVKHFFSIHFSHRLLSRVKSNLGSINDSSILRDEQIKELSKKYISEIFTLSPEILEKMGNSIVYWIQNGE